MLPRTIHFLFFNNRRRLIICGLAGALFLFGYLAPAAADIPKPIARIFEFTLDSHDENDKGLLANIQFILRDSLNRLQSDNIIQNTKIISRNTLNALEIDTVEDFSELGVRFIVEGGLKDLSVGQDKKMEVTINFYDLEKSNQEPIHPWNECLKKDLTVLTSWIEGIGEDINDLIQGQPIKQDVYTYCFKIKHGDAAEGVLKTLTLITNRLPIELADRLKAKLEERGLMDRFELSTFDNPDEVEVLCAKGGDYLKYKHRYNYLISGQVSSEDEIKIVVFVEDDSSDTPLVVTRGFVFENSDDSFEKLADHILEWWPQLP